jgi:hypothetical protein
MVSKGESNNQDRETQRERERERESARELQPTTYLITKSLSESEVVFKLAPETAVIEKVVPAVNELVVAASKRMSFWSVDIVMSLVVMTFTRFPSPSTTAKALTCNVLLAEN